MASIKITELNEKTQIELNDVFPIVDITANETRKITAENLLKSQYSTSEIKTNETWINGKPIYKKTIYISALPNNTIGEYPTGITNAEQIVDITGQYQGIVGGYFTTRPLNFYIVGTEGSNIATYIGSNNYIKISTKSNQSGFSGYVTMKYTKTTD